MKTKSQIFKEAHLIAKTFEGDYKACFSEALKISYKNAKENFTPDFIKAQDAKLTEMPVNEIFERLNGMIWGSKFDMRVDWNPFATEILMVVKEKSTGFQSDIAERALEGKDLTYKQKWCVAYEYKNVA